jgi:cytochrome P450
MIVDLAERAQARLGDGATVDATVDVGPVVARLTLAVAAKIVFDTNIDCEADQVGAAMTRAGRHRRARAQLEQLLQQRIAARRAAGVDVGDLLSALVAAGRSDAQIRAEALALLTGDRERTTGALLWSLQRLARQPGAEDRIVELFDEALRHCGGEPLLGLGRSLARLQGQLILATWARRLRPLPT